MSNILYISCHCVLEWDEIQLLTELGHSVFSCGAYIDPLLPVEKLRDGVNLIQKKEWLEIFYKTNCSMLPNGTCNLSKEFISEFDTIIYMHHPQSLVNSIKSLSGKKVFWRSIGQSNYMIEQSISKIKNDIKIIRYSPMESLIRNFAGQDHLVRFYKDEKEYLTRVVSIDKIAIFYNNFVHRSGFFNISYYNSKIKGLPHDIFGGNQIGGNFLGETSYEEQKKILSTYAAAYIVNTYPAQYTLSFIESLAAKIPIIIDYDNRFKDERFKLLESNKIFYETDIKDSLILAEKLKIQERVFKNNFDKLLIKKSWNSIL